MCKPWPPVMCPIANSLQNFPQRSDLFRTQHVTITQLPSLRCGRPGAVPGAHAARKQAIHSKLASSSPHRPRHPNTSVESAPHSISTRCTQAAQAGPQDARGSLADRRLAQASPHPATPVPRPASSFIRFKDDFWGTQPQDTRARAAPEHVSRTAVPPPATPPPPPSTPRPAGTRRSAGVNAAAHATAPAIRLSSITGQSGTQHACPGIPQTVKTTQSCLKSTGGAMLGAELAASRHAHAIAVRPAQHAHGTVASTAGACQLTTTKRHPRRGATPTCTQNLHSMLRATRWASTRCARRR